MLINDKIGYRVPVFIERSLDAIYQCEQVCAPLYLIEVRARLGAKSDSRISVSCTLVAQSRLNRIAAYEPQRFSNGMAGHVHVSPVIHFHV